MKNKRKNNCCYKCKFLSKDKLYCYCPPIYGDEGDRGTCYWIHDGYIDDCSNCTSCDGFKPKRNKK